LGKSEEGIEFILNIEKWAEAPRNLLFKSEASTNPNYGYYPWKRPIEEYIKYGVINLDKPPGPTSHEVVAWIKRMFNLSKAGHGGTLEPTPV